MAMSLKKIDEKIQKYKHTMNIINKPLTRVRLRREDANKILNNLNKGKDLTDRDYRESLDTYLGLDVVII